MGELIGAAEQVSGCENCEDRRVDSSGLYSDSILSIVVHALLLLTSKHVWAAIERLPRCRMF